MTRNEDVMKAYLLRGWDAEKRVQAREAQLDVLHDRMKRVRSAAPRVTGDRRGAQVDWTDVVDTLVDAEAEYLQDIASLYQVKAEIKRAISGLMPEHYRALLEYRYVDGLNWDNVAERLHYERRYVLKLHERALRALEEKLNGEGKVWERQ